MHDLDLQYNTTSTRLVVCNRSQAAIVLKTISLFSENYFTFFIEKPKLLNLTLP